MQMLRLVYDSFLTSGLFYPQSRELSSQFRFFLENHLAWLLLLERCSSPTSFDFNGPCAPSNFTFVEKFYVCGFVHLLIASSCRRSLLSQFLSSSFTEEESEAKRG